MQTKKKTTGENATTESQAVLLDPQRESDQDEERIVQGKEVSC